MRRRNLFAILTAIAVIAVVAVLGVNNAFSGQNAPQAYSGPTEILMVKAKLTGGYGSEIMVEFTTKNPLPEDLTTNQTYMVHESSNTTLGVQWVPRVGYVESKSKGYTNGWFMIHNLDNVAQAGDLMTIVIHDVKIEHYVLLPAFY
jgi:hypothetical protein